MPQVVPRLPDLTDDHIEALAGSRDNVVAQLATEIRRLRDGIKEHRSATGHELCWLNDVALWTLIGEDAAPAYPHETLPVREEFLSQCCRYYESRIAGSAYEEPRPRTCIKKA